MSFVIPGDLHERRDGQHRGVPGHREEQVDAHGHQLLPLQPRLLWPHDARSRWVQGVPIKYVRKILDLWTPFHAISHTVSNGCPHSDSLDLPRQFGLSFMRSKVCMAPAPSIKHVIVWILRPLVCMHYRLSYILYLHIQVMPAIGQNNLPSQCGRPSRTVSTTRMHNEWWREYLAHTFPRKCVWSCLPGTSCSFRTRIILWQTTVPYGRELYHTEYKEVSICAVQVWMMERDSWCSSGEYLRTNDGHDPPYFEVHCGNFDRDLCLVFHLKNAAFKEPFRASTCKAFSNF